MNVLSLYKEAALLVRTAWGDFESKMLCRKKVHYSIAKGRNIEE
jgi:hypothetical protein